jgi:hypothetical protein
MTPILPALNLRAFSLGEGVRLALIGGSLSIIILAGQLAQSRNQDIGESVSQPIPAVAVAPETRAEPVRVQHRSTPSERFARSQIQTFSELLDGLTERAEVVLDTAVISESESVQLEHSLQRLDGDLMNAREAYVRFERARDRFSEEDLRASLLAVQDSASRAQGELISIDQPERMGFTDQGFKVSRTGQ